MFKFLMMIFFIGFLLFSLLGFSVIRSFRDFFMGNPKSKDRQRSASNNRQSGNKKTSSRQNQANRKKVIADNEGEYVDYVEIKE